MNFIRNREGTIIGRWDGNWLRDGTGKLVARYDKSDNRTRDRNGKIRWQRRPEVAGIGPLGTWRIKSTNPAHWLSLKNLLCARDRIGHCELPVDNDGGWS